MCKEKKEEEDLPIFNIASIQRLEDYIKSTQKTIYSDQKQYRQNKHQQNKNHQKTKMERKTIALIFQAANKRNLENG